MNLKKKALTLLSVIVALTLALSSVDILSFADQSGDGTSKAEKYNAFEEFSETSNPSGVWSYMYRTDTASDFVLINEVYSGIWQNANGFLQAAADLVVSTVPNAVQLGTNDQTSEVALAFTAPDDGKITVRMTNGGVYAPGIGTPDVVRFSLIKNTETLRSFTVYNYNSNNDRQFADTMTLDVKSGDMLYFAVGRNLPVGGAYAVFNPEIEYIEYGDKTVFDAVSEYSTDGNPSGTWSYQSFSNGEYTYDTFNVETGRWQAASGLTTLEMLTNDEVSGNPAIMMTTHSKGDKAVLTFTSPYSGEIEVSMTNGGVYAPATNAQNSPGNAVFAMLHNEKEITSAELDASVKDFFSDTVTLSVSQGDTLRFTVDRLDAGKPDSAVRFAPKIEYLSIGEDEDDEPDIKEEYDAYADYRTEYDQADVWQYLKRDTATGAESKLYYSAGSWGVPGDGSVTSSTQDMVTGKPALSLHPGITVDAVVSFTAPYSGTIELSMANGGVFAPMSADGILFSVYIGDTLYYSEVSSPATVDEGKRVFADTRTLEVEAGDVIYFVVNNNGNNASDSTFLNPHIKYTEITDTDNKTLRFAENDVITVSDTSKDGFSISWPSARGGKGGYSYTVYISEQPFEGAPASGGVSVNSARNHRFEGLTPGKNYYIAVTATDGEAIAVLTADTPVMTVSRAFIFDAYDDFTSKVQTSVWSYCSVSSDGSMDELVWTETVWGNASDGTVTAEASDLVTGKPALAVTPGNDKDTAVIFTAPYSGTVEISLRNGGIFVPYNGAGNDYDGINFSLMVNGYETASFNAVNASNSHPSSAGDMYKGRVFDGVYTSQVKAGDKIIFTVNKNKAAGNDITYFDPEIIYTQVSGGTDNLKFTPSRSISESDVTDKSFTVFWPGAVGGTGNYSYTLYLSDKPIESIPSAGGISLGNKLSYEVKNLSAYTNYYAAVTVNDGVNTAYLIRTTPISTIGNSYKFTAVGGYTEGVQPISTPWRYYYTEYGKHENFKVMQWDEQTGCFGSASTATAAKTDSDLVTGKPSLVLVPTLSSDSVLAFIAPFTGRITVKMENDGVFAPLNGTPQQFDGINFKFYHNDKVIYSKDAVTGQNSHSDRCFGVPISLDVKKGDVLYFTVNSNKTADCDSVFLNPSVTYTFVEKGSDAFGFLPGAEVAMSDATATSFVLNWSAAFSPVAERITYSVYLSEKPFEGEPAGKPHYTGENTYAECKGLEIGRTYYVYIKAVGASGAVAALKNSSFTSYCPVYNAYDDFSTDNSPGIWNYTRRSYDAELNEYSYTLLNYDEKSGVYGSAEGGLISIAESDMVTGNPAISMHPGTAGRAAALVFTAPYSGNITVTLKNGAVFTPMNGKDQEFDGIRYSVLKGEDQLFLAERVNSENNAQDKRIGTETITTYIEYGQRIYFIVDANKTNASDITFLNPEIAYQNITGGSGVPPTDGFNTEAVTEDTAQQEDKMFISSFRENLYTKTAGKAIPFPADEEPFTSYLPYIIAAAVLAAGCAVLIGFLIPRKKIKE